MDPTPKRKVEGKVHAELRLSGEIDLAELTRHWSPIEAQKFFDRDPVVVDRLWGMIEEQLRVNGEGDLTVDLR